VIRLDSDLLLGFSGAVLSARYDQPKPTPNFHKELWDLCCDKARHIAAAAPRGHAKTTAVTQAYTLCNVLFRLRSNVLIISDTEAQAKSFLGDIKMELLENDILRQDFAIGEIVKDNETEIIVKFTDGEMFRILARGSEQKLRGLKWRGKRPDLIICDDMENEELVSNPDRRAKFKDWFLGSLLPAGGDGCLIRVVGTILHLDSMLENLLNNPGWKTRRFSAHNEDFSEILWPEKFSKADLLAIRAMYIHEGRPDVYSREYLNIPISAEHAFFRTEDFQPIEKEQEALNFYLTTDLAVSTSNQADYSAFVVGGLNSANVLKIVEVIRQRMSSDEIINTIFELYWKYKPYGGINIVGLEGGPIARTLVPLINSEMLRRNTFFHLEVLPPIGDKRLRAQPIRARMRQGQVQFDRKAPWFGDFQSELLVFDKGKHDDQVDALAWLGQLLDKMQQAPTTEDIINEEYNSFVSEYQEFETDLGMDAECGY